MDSWELNKIAAAVLSALLVIVGTSTFFEIATSSHGAAKPGYVLPVEVASASAAGAAPAAAAAAFSFDALKPILAKASPEAGAAAFKKCAACHTPNEGGRNGTGPNLWGVVNRNKGAVAGFNYSDAVKAKGGAWTFENLALFLNNPKGWMPGNKMAFNGVRDNQELADLLAYLRSLSGSPAPLPQ